MDVNVEASLDTGSDMFANVDSGLRVNGLPT